MKKNEAEVKMEEILNQVSKLLYEAMELAEDNDLKFSVDHEGLEGTYTSLGASGWESSNCEWEQSASYGEDYGWNV